MKIDREVIPQAMRRRTSSQSLVFRFAMAGKASPHSMTKASCMGALTRMTALVWFLTGMCEARSIVAVMSRIISCWFPTHCLDRPLVDQKRHDLESDYYLWGVVTSNDAPHLEIYARRDRLAAEQEGSPRTLARRILLIITMRSCWRPLRATGSWVRSRSPILPRFALAITSIS